MGNISLKTFSRNDISSSVKNTYELFKLSAKKFISDLCLERSSALAYMTLISLIPCLAIIFVIYNSFSKEKLLELLTNLFHRYLVPTSAVNVVDFFTRQIEVISHSTASISMIGLLLFIITGVSLMNTIERVFNDIYRARKNRSYLSKIKSYWAMVSLSPLLIFVSISFSTSLKSYWLVENLSHYYLFRWMMALGPPFLLVWLAFLLMFIVMPNTRVNFRSAAIGALVSAILWSMTKTLFEWYFKTIVPQNKFYGGLGSVPFFLLWIYISWIVVLFGLETSFTHQYRKSLSGGYLLDIHNAVNYIQALFLGVFLIIADDFNQNRQQSTVKSLITQLGIPETEIHFVLEKLVEENLIHAVDDREGFYSPSRPLDKISVNDVLKSARAEDQKTWVLNNNLLQSRVNNILGELEKTIDGTTKNMSIKQVLQESN